MTNGWKLAQSAALANRLGSSIVTVFGAELPSEQWAEVRNDFFITERYAVSCRNLPSAHTGDG